MQESGAWLGLAASGHLALWRSGGAGRPLHEQVAVKANAVSRKDPFQHLCAVAVARGAPRNAQDGSRQTHPLGKLALRCYMRELSSVYAAAWRRAVGYGHCSTAASPHALLRTPEQLGLDRHALVSATADRPARHGEMQTRFFHWCCSRGVVDSGLPIIGGA